MANATAPVFGSAPEGYDDGNPNYEYDPITGGLVRTPTGGSGGSGGTTTPPNPNAYGTSQTTTDATNNTTSDGTKTAQPISTLRDKLLSSLSSPLGASYLNTANWVNPYSPIMPVGEFPGSAGAVNPWEGLGMKLSQHQYTPPVYQRTGPANYGTYTAGTVRHTPKPATPQSNTGGGGSTGNTGNGTAPKPPAPGSVHGSWTPPYDAPKSPETAYATTNPYNTFMETNRRLALRGQDPYYKDYPSTTDKTQYMVEQTQVPWLAPYVNDPNPVITGTGYVPDYMKARQTARLAEGGEVPGAEDYGRYGDSMLVHMAPEEVAGLAALARQHGRELTTNPVTGYPEAFRLKDLLVPAAMAGLTFMTGGAGAGAAAGLAGGTAGAGLGAGLSTGLGAVLSNPLMTAAIPGAMTYARTGDIKQSLGAAGMGWAGGQLMSSMGQLGAQAAGAGEAANAVQGAAQTATPSLTSAENLMNPSLVTQATQPAASGADYFSNISKGFGKIMDSPDVAKGYLKDNVLPIGAGVIGALAYDSAAMDNRAGEREEDKERRLRRVYGNIRNTYAAQGRTSPWLNGYAEGGEVQPFNMESGGFVIPHDVVSRVGGGDPETGLKALEIHIGAVPIRGPGTGTSDSIPATIDGNEPALVSNQEAYVPKVGVKALGGPETLYNFIHQAKGKKAR